MSSEFKALVDRIKKEKENPGRREPGSDDNRCAEDILENFEIKTEDDLCVVLVAATLCNDFAKGDCVKEEQSKEAHEFKKRLARRIENTFLKGNIDKDNWYLSKSSTKPEDKNMMFHAIYCHGLLFSFHFCDDVDFNEEICGCEYKEVNNIWKEEGGIELKYFSIELFDEAIKLGGVSEGNNKAKLKKILAQR
ncbi:MAG: hypothetical protein LBG64_03085 [Pseudomonadales bacterium]|nr:hypothetical protein [Pseudomonadales bacterium]